MSYFDKIWNRLIKPNCKQILQANLLASRLLYRGFNSNEPVIRGRSHDRRTPLDSSSVTTQEFDRRLAALGFKALRSNSVFCTGNVERAKEFGKPYIIFPIDGFDFTYCVDKYDVSLTHTPSPDDPEYAWLRTEDLGEFEEIGRAHV